MTITINTKPAIRLADIGAFLLCPNLSIEYPKGYCGLEWFKGGAEGIAALCEKTIAEKNRKITIAIPGYFCGQTIRFLRSMPVNIVFYELLEGLTPDFQKLEEQFSHAEVDIFVLVHYFGAIQSQRESRIFADAHNAILLEDAAHVCSHKQKDWLGDYLLFCPHKHFASAPIAFLVHKAPNFFNSESKHHEYPFFPVKWLLKQVIRPIFKRNISSWGAVYSKEVQNIKRKLPDRHSIKVALYNLQNSDDSARARKNNATILLEQLSHIGGWHQFISLSMSDTPYLLAMVCDDANIARRRYKQLNVRHSLVMQWPDMPCELQSSKAICSQVADWRDCVLLFFVHQQLDVEKWLKEVSQVVNAQEF